MRIGRGLLELQQPPRGLHVVPADPLGKARPRLDRVFQDILCNKGATSLFDAHQSTARETIDKPPSPIADQPAPKPPSARSKSSEPGSDVDADALQVTETPVTFADATVPAPPATVQSSPLGLRFTITL